MSVFPEQPNCPTSGGMVTATTGNVNATKVVGAGYIGIFGNGQHSVFYTSGTFTVPSNISKIRVRVIGGGGGGGSGNTSGGGGGGYAHGVFNVSGGSAFTVTVAASAPAGTSGGTSSFGSLISATGGVGANTAAIHAGGTGIGGDFQSSGGSAGAAINSGGGGSGSQLGDGGSTTGTYSGGGGVANGYTLATSGGGSAFSSSTPEITEAVGNGALDILGLPQSTSTTSINPINASFRFPFDSFTGGGGYTTGTAGSKGGIGGGGGGGSNSAGRGGIGGGGGGTTATGGSGGIGGGGGGGTSNGGTGGSGLVIIEW